MSTYICGANQIVHINVANHLRQVTTLDTHTEVQHSSKCQGTQLTCHQGYSPKKKEIINSILY